MAIARSMRRRSGRISGRQRAEVRGEDIVAVAGCVNMLESMGEL